MKRILLVDDYLDALESWSLFLESHGYEVVTATTGPEAIERARQSHPDVVLLDIQLPDMNGVEVARHLRSATATARIPLLAVTGFSRWHDRESARKAGFDSLILKPCDPQVLLAEIEQVLAGQPDRSQNCEARSTK